MSAPRGEGIGALKRAELALNQAGRWFREYEKIHRNRNRGIFCEDAEVEALAAQPVHEPAPLAQTVDAERERLARMVDALAEGAESMAESWRHAENDKRARTYVSRFDAEAADWRKIASILRATPAETARAEEESE